MFVGVKFVAMESVATIQLLSDDEGVCAHEEIVAIGNVSHSCGGTEGEMHTETTCSTVQRFVETNALIGEAVAAEEETAWKVLREKLVANQKLWMPHHRNSLVWAFYLLKDGTMQNLDTSKPQILRCVVCHPSPPVSSSSHTMLPSKNTQNRVGILKYNAEYGLSSIKKHVERDHQQ